MTRAVGPLALLCVSLGGCAASTAGGTAEPHEASSPVVELTQASKPSSSAAPPSGARRKAAGKAIASLDGEEKQLARSALLLRRGLLSRGLRRQGRGPQDAKRGRALMDRACKGGDEKACADLLTL